MSIEQQIRAKQEEIRRLSAQRRRERDLREFAFETPRVRVSAVILPFPQIGARSMSICNDRSLPAAQQVEDDDSCECSDCEGAGEIWGGEYGSSVGPEPRLYDAPWRLACETCDGTGRVS